MGGALLLAPALALAQPASPGPDGFSTPKVVEGAPPDKPAAAVPDAPKTPPPEPPPSEAPVTPPPAPSATPPSGFAFGSYGRMIAATDFKGRPGRDAEIVARGSRLDESNYVELELRRDDYWKKTDSTTHLVATLAFTNPIFHYNGDFNVKMAVRNLYMEERDLGAKGLAVWVGSRMYRGDDIYVLDYWPLDTLNTMGAGARYEALKNTTIAIHGGLNQPKSPFYLQEVQRPATLNQLGATTVAVLSRQRFIGSAKVTHHVPLGEGGFKVVAYAEAHHLPGGQRELKPREFETLPGDDGFLIGAQLGAWTGKRDSHLNLYLRYARGLAAYGELATPTQLGPDQTVMSAREMLVAIGGNWETGPFGLLAGGYLRSFRNASPDLDYGDVDEGVFVVRPQVFFGEIGGLGVEASYQAQQRGVVTLSGSDGQPAQSSGPLTAGLARFGVIPFLSPAGRGSFSRPQFRLIYTVTLRNQAARSLYPIDDVFSLRGTEHFFGIGAEWWFNSSTYSR